VGDATNTRKHTVQLTDEQIALVRTSLDSYSERVVRNHEYGVADRAWASEQQHEQDEMIASVREALEVSPFPTEG
jgi:hypothetical protein